MMRAVGDNFLWTSSWDGSGMQGSEKCDGSELPYSAYYSDFVAAEGLTLSSDGSTFTMPDLTGTAPTGLTAYAVVSGLFPSDHPVPIPNYRLVDDNYLGEVIYSSDTYPPSGWALCDGSILQVNQNTSLLSLIGFTFGGNGKTTFALPNIDGAFIALTGIYPSRGRG